MNINVLSFYDHWYLGDRVIVSKIVFVHLFSSFSSSLFHGEKNNKRIKDNIVITLFKAIVEACFGIGTVFGPGKEHIIIIILNF